MPDTKKTTPAKASFLKLVEDNLRHTLRRMSEVQDEEEKRKRLQSGSRDLSLGTAAARIRARRDQSADR